MLLRWYNEKKQEPSLPLNLAPVYIIWPPYSSGGFTFPSTILLTGSLITIDTNFFTFPALEIQCYCWLIIFLYTFGNFPISFKNFFFCLPTPSLLLVPRLHVGPAWNYWCSVHLSETLFPVFHFVENFHPIFKSASFFFCKHWVCVSPYPLYFSNCCLHLKKSDLGILCLPGLCWAFSTYGILLQWVPIFLLSNSKAHAHLPKLVTDDWLFCLYLLLYMHGSGSTHC